MPVNLPGSDGLPQATVYVSRARARVASGVGEVRFALSICSRSVVLVWNRNFEMAREWRKGQLPYAMQNSPSYVSTHGSWTAGL